MPVSRKQWDAIRRVIEEAHSALVVTFVDPKAVTPEVLARLKALGLVDYQGEIIKDAYLLGRLLSAAKPGATPPDLSLAQMRQKLARDPVPLSSHEERAVEMANARAGQYIVGLGNRIAQKTGAVIIEADAKLRAKMRGIVRDKVAQNIARRASIKRLRSDIYHETGDGTRDLDRIAVTEKQTALQEGYAATIAKDSGPDALVAKRSAPTCCKHCQMLYNRPDGRPRVFRLSDLEANGTNVGRRATDWKPVISATHPHCCCELIQVPPGFGFNERGQMVFGGRGGQPEGTHLEASRKVDTVRPRLRLRKTLSAPSPHHPPRTPLKVARTRARPRPS